jgi:hypothetical protein
MAVWTICGVTILLIVVLWQFGSRFALAVSGLGLRWIWVDLLVCRKWRLSLGTGL